MKKLFGSKKDKKQKSLYSVMLDWYEGLSDDSKNHMYNGVENDLLNAIMNITPDESLFIENIARIVSELRIDDWAEVTVRNFVTSMEAFKETVESLKYDSTAKKTGGYKLYFTDSNGEEVVKTFDKTEYSDMANVMYSDVESMISEYGDALSKNEKRQILIDIINNLLG
jgi:hypothetical protein